MSNNPKKYTGPTNHQDEPWWKKYVEKVRQYWARLDPFKTTSFNSSEFQPSSDQIITKDSIVLKSLSLKDVQNLLRIMENPDEVERLSQLAEVFQYRPQEKYGVGTLNYAMMSEAERAKIFAESYGIKLGDMAIMFDPNFRIGGDGLYKSPGETYRNITFSRATIIIGPATFDHDEILGRTLFHEVLERQREMGILTHEQVYELEQAWVEWYRSLNP